MDTVGTDMAMGTVMATATDTGTEVTATDAGVDMDTDMGMDPATAMATEMDMDPMTATRATTWKMTKMPKNPPPRSPKLAANARSTLWLQKKWRAGAVRPLISQIMQDVKSALKDFTFRGAWPQGRDGWLVPQSAG